MDTNKHKVGRTVLEHLWSVRHAINSVNDSDVERVVELLASTRDSGDSVWIIGNGGSAATASHFANDLVKACGIRAFAVADHTPAVLAYGNDTGWENMFTEYLRVNANHNDVLVAISCSGKSANIISAAREFLFVVAMTGNPQERSGLVDEASHIIYAPAKDIKVQEDVHMAICHAIVGALAL